MTAANMNFEGPIEEVGITEDPEGSSQYLAFSIAEEIYGVDILRVQEIRGWTPVTTVPNTPEHVRGVLNMRGTVVPVLDLRMRFDMEEVDYTPTTVVIVLSVMSGEKEKIIGVVVDAVDDVLDVNDGNIKPAPDIGASVDLEFIRGVATTDERMIMLLDVDRLFGKDELEMGR